MKGTKLRDMQMEASRNLPALEEEIADLRRKKTAYKGHGVKTVQLSEEIKQKQAQARKYRKILKQEIPASAYTLPAKHSKTLLHSKESEMRPMVGGLVSPK